MASSFNVEAQQPGRTGNVQRMAQVLLHIEKNGLWPASKAILCSSLIVQIVNNSYCWGYGRNFDLNPPSRIKRQAGVLDATVGGTVTIYDPFGVTAIGLIEMDVYPLE
ncbi:hypothetical protein LTR09_009750 [Extremus antarcticus]|uniref:Uncharacterized protein n=1 Tax=Extremus antarcticus TaxID=702011 RepID=A0AAJ0DEZ4_9PEZI|nr:hypothetical protein LTR09_009750 [Extremus antarcticus]